MLKRKVLKSSTKVDQWRGTRHADSKGVEQDFFVGDNLNSRFPNDDGVQIFLSFDVEALSEASSVVAATLSSSNTRVEGSPYTDLGNLIAQDISYNEFSSALWNHAVGDFFLYLCHIPGRTI